MNLQHKLVKRKEMRGCSDQDPPPNTILKFERTITAAIKGYPNKQKTWFISLINTNTCNVRCDIK